MGVPILETIFKAVDSISGKIWPDKTEKEKNQTAIKLALMENAMSENKLLFQDTENARLLAEKEVLAQNVPKWARAIQVLGRPFALYSTVGMYVWVKIAPMLPWDIPVIELSQYDYYLIGTVFVFLFGARTIEKIKGRS